MSVRYTTAEREAIIAAHIKRHDGVYRPAEFLAAARNPKHAAHGWFTWDDTAAAEAWRMNEARAFVSGLRIRYTVEEGTVAHPRIRVVDVPAYISPQATRSRGGHYEPLRAEEHMAALCDEGRRALDAWLWRYGGALTWAGGDDDGIKAAIATMAARAPVAAVA